jgi:ankyrin repeat protein
MSTIVVLLVSKNADVNSQSKFKWTPLMQACTRGHLSVCSLLIAAGANLDLTNSDGSTALEIATSKGNQAIVNLLLAEGADRNCKGENARLSLSSD